MKVVLLPNMNCKLETPISKDELKKALCALPKNSCPSEDGLLVVFFLEHWETIGDRLNEACNDIFNSGIMPASMAAGLIYIIPKGERQSPHVAKWRPITLLNTV